MHHQAAVSMAKLALEQAKHPKLKQLATHIINNQDIEIKDMQQWQKKYKYLTDDTNMVMDHSSVGMMNDMGDMTTGLNSKSGDDFDKTFITEMTAHHQSAIDMSVSATTNAKHQEVMQLASSIISAQTKEIKQRNNGNLSGVINKVELTGWIID